MFVSETRFVVRYAETDQMGIVHHSNYPIWYEAGRTDFIRQLGMPYSQIEAQGVLLPLIELNCKYKSYSKYEDQITVKTRVKELSYTRITFSYEVYRNDEPDAVNYGETMHVWTNTELKPVNIRKYASHLYELMLEAVK